MKAWHVFVLAALLRLVASASHAHEGLTITDERSYRAIAATMADGHGYRESADGSPEIIRGPTYSAFLAAVFRLTGVGLWVPLLLQALLGALVVLVLTREVARIDARLAAVAGALMALSPYAILYERLLLSEGVALALTAFAVVAWTRRTRAWTIGAGVIFGVLILAKPAYLLLPIFLAAGETLLDRKQWRAHAQRAAIILVMELLIVAPWTLRNWRATHHFIPVGIGGGVYLYLGTMPSVLANTFDYSSFPELKRYLDTHAPVEERIAVDRECSRKAVAIIEAQPLAWASLAAKRAIKLWAASHVSALEPRQFAAPFRAAWTLLSVLLVLAAVWGFWRAPPEQRRLLLPFALVPIYLTLVHTPISSGARYVVPGWHFVLILATSSIVRAAGRIRSSS